jgi:SGNH hydrolase-like domain, acetyltransferase AlgX
MRKHVVNYSMLLAVLAVCFLGGEWMIRILPVSDRMGANLVPSVEERVMTAAANPRHGARILVFGDSFTEWRDTTGDNYARVAERALRDRDSDLELINLGEGGTGLYDYYSNLVRYADRLHPDLIILGIYVGNDLVPSKLPIGSDLSIQAAIHAPDVKNRYAGVTHFLKQSIALNYMFRVAKQFVPALRSDHFDKSVAALQRQTGRDDSYISRRLAVADPLLVDAARAEAINVWDLATGIFFPSYYGDLASAADGTAAGGSVDGFLRDFAELVAYCRKKGYALAVVLIPPRVWVSERNHPYFRRLGYTELGPVSGPVPVIEKVRAALLAQGIPTLDLLPVLRSVHDEIFIEDDIHLNRGGHERAGRALARFLRDAGLPPGGASRTFVQSGSR